MRTLPLPVIVGIKIFIISAPTTASYNVSGPSVVYTQGKIAGSGNVIMIQGLCFGKMYAGLFWEVWQKQKKT